MLFSMKRRRKLSIGSGLLIWKQSEDRRRLEMGVLTARQLPTIRPINLPNSN